MQPSSPVDRRKSPSDRRAHPRVPFVAAVCKTTARRVTLCQAANLSSRGMELVCVDDDHGDDVGDGCGDASRGDLGGEADAGAAGKVWLRFELPGTGHEVCGEAQVVSERPSGSWRRVGVRFLELHAAAAAAIHGLLGESGAGDGSATGG